jgi:hypothetical protein
MLAALLKPRHSKARVVLSGTTEGRALPGYF